MSFLSEVIRCADETEILAVDRRLTALMKTLPSHKDLLCRLIDSGYKTFTQFPNKNLPIFENVKQLCEEIDGLQISTSHVGMNESKKQQVDLLNDKLQQAKLECYTVSTLAEMYRKLAKIKDYKCCNDYLSAAKETKDLDLLLQDFSNNDSSEIVSTLNKALQLERMDFDKVINRFQEFLIMKEESKTAYQKNTLKIRKNLDTEMIGCLKALDVLHVEFNRFNKFILKCFFKPIINHGGKVFKHEDSDFNTLLVTFKRGNSPVCHKSMLEMLLQVFEFIRICINIDVDSSCVLFYLGQDTSEEFAKMLFEKGVFSNSSLVNDIDNFEKLLAELNFLQEDTNPILEYINEMDMTLSRKICTAFSKEALFVMKKFLGETIKVNTPADEIDNLMQEYYISRSMTELIDLIRKTLNMLLNQPSSTDAQLISTIQSCAYQYGYITYGHHKTTIQNVPEQMAIFHNNCMYFAHHLRQLNKSHSKKFSKDALPMPPLFQDENLQSFGNEMLLSYTVKRVTSMLHSLKESHFTSDELAAALNQSTFAHIVQCFHSYHNLGVTWNKLPAPVHHKTLGSVLNALCKYIIDTVLKASKIHRINADGLHKICTQILTQAPKTFVDSDNIHLYVKLWQKFDDLVFMLDADLSQISAKWEVGYLKAQFTPTEVKNLVWALFEDSEEKVNVLTCIQV